MPSDKDLNAWRADLETRHSALKAEESHLRATLETMEPLIAARALRALADRMDALEAEWLELEEEAGNRG